MMAGSTMKRTLFLFAGLFVLGIESILNEEVSAYFSDDKTAEESARMIQDWVSTYLVEY